MRANYLILILLLFNSCDPAKILIIKASNKPNVSVTIYSNKSVLPRVQNQDNKKITLRIPLNDTAFQRDTLFYYGIGCWCNAKHISDFSRNIDSIIIMNSNEKIILNNQTQINEYLMKQRHGYANSKLTIEAK